MTERPFRFPPPHIAGTDRSYNWVYDAKKYGYRWDAHDGLSGLHHHNVGMNLHGAFQIKGDDHDTHNNTGLGGLSKNDFIILAEYSDVLGHDENINSRTWNNLGDKIAGHRTDSVLVVPIPGDHTNNWNGYLESGSASDQLRDVANLDFRPKSDSDLVDSGKVIAGITDGYVGSAPDIGAYESGDSNYWIPGCQAAQACTPIPLHGSDNVKTNADLMWLEGYQATSHNIYFGTESGSLPMIGNQTNNIFNPGPLAEGQTYYWRIDAVTPTGTVAGTEWKFSVDTYFVSATISFNPLHDSYVQDTSPNSNYGSDSQLKLITQITYGYNREAYMKFDVDVPGEIVSATLELHNSGGSHTKGVGIYSMTDTSWDEATLTWNNRPPIDGVHLDDQDVNSGSWASFEVSSVVVSNGLVSFGLIRDPLDSQRSIDSRESAFAPVLKVEYVPDTDYFADWAGGYALGSESGLLDNPDGDMFNNLTEYALGGSPTDPGDAAAIVPIFDGMHYIYRRRTDATERELTYTLEARTNLVAGSWSVIAAAPSGVAPLEVGFEAVTNQIVTTNDSRFVRLRISAPANLPPLFAADPLTKASGIENVAYSGSVAGDASEPEHNSMTFSRVSGPAWLSMASDGTLSGTPGVGDLGLNTFMVQVNAAGGSDTAMLNITVLANQPPAFTADPFSKGNAATNSAYGGSVAGAASDPENDAMTFSKVSGPAWLSVASDGTLSGTPGAGDLGLNTFTVQVDATGGSDAATVNITVSSVGAMPSGYPAGVGTNVGDEWISRVQFSTIDQSSGADGGYVDRTTVSASVTAGSSHTMTVTYGYSGTAFSENLSIWIDFNRDGDFTDAGEQCLTVSNQQYSGSGSITIPSGASLGETRMRVAMSYSSQAGLSADGSGSFTYGEVEDYKLVVE
ncbi:CBM96 family carbohydrate-binding protein [Pontiella sulfatireligans]|uniref:Staphylococcus aureus surface protein A n=1 Tax=Pontiella sulfatireligans TaxID=2750658 RepID=A0A6C2UGL9_9BACT|nr:DNRLRE domain-containing protein [Pontiella sulfatireligans]VGO19330.1 hypothetical protein SCARR_01388 [Pontiella sulfatireligans]